MEHSEPKFLIQVRNIIITFCGDRQVYKNGLTFTGYHDSLSGNLLRHGSLECHTRVRNAFDVLLYLFENNQSEYIRERLRLCTAVDPDDEQGVALLFEMFIDLISNYIRQQQ